MALIKKHPGKHVWLHLKLIIRDCLEADEVQTELDVATCGVANVTSFYTVGTKFSYLVTNLASKIGHFLIWYTNDNLFSFTKLMDN